VKRFCPKCGKEGKEEEFINGFCKECYLSEHNLVDAPDEIVVEHCKRCDAVRFRGLWVEQDDVLIRSLVKSKIKARDLSDMNIETLLSPIGNGTTLAEVKINGKLNGREIAIEKEILLKPRNMLCDSCMKIGSDYFEATVQIRFGENPTPVQVKDKVAAVEKFLRTEKRRDALAEIVSVRKDRKGADLLIGSKHAAKVAAQFLAKKAGTKIKTSFSVKGIDSSGKQKKKFTFCVRV